MHFDPIVFFLSAQTLLWFAVLLELAVCSIVCFHTSRIVRHYVLALLGSLFVSYQLGLWLGISSDAMRIIDFLLLLYIWLPSGAVLARWLGKRKQRNASFGKGKTPSNVLFLLAIALSSTLPNNQAAETFQLEGKVDIVGFDYEDPSKMLEPFTAFFSVAIQEKGQWRMHYETPGYPDDGHFFVYGSDGKDTYGVWYAMVLRQPPTQGELRLPPGSEAKIEAIKNRPIQKVFNSPEETDSNWALITPGVYPYDLFRRPVPRVIWFALASDHYLNTSTNISRMPAFWTDIRERPFAFTFENEIETFPQWPRLPRKAKFLTLGRDSLPDNPAIMPKIDYPTDQRTKSMLEEELDILEYIEAGHLGMEYACINQTNIGGAVLPLKFEFRSYWPGYLESYFKTNELAELVVGQVTNVIWEKETLPLGKPPIRSKTVKIDDYRFRDRAEGGTMNYLTHATTNKIWPVMNDPHVQLYYEDRKMKEQQAKWNVFGSFAGLVLMLLVLLTAGYALAK